MRKHHAKYSRARLPGAANPAEIVIGADFVKGVVTDLPADSRRPRALRSRITILIGVFGESIRVQSNMGATTTMVTIREFLQLSEHEDERMELIGGEIVTMGFGKAPARNRQEEPDPDLWWSGWRSTRLLSYSPRPVPARRQQFSDAGSERGVPGHIAPGIADWPQGGPGIPIEVVSSETAARLEQKIDLYLAHGSKSVWVAFPEQRIVRIYDASGRSTKFEQNQTLEDPNVLPGFSTPVSAIFEGV